MVKPELGLHLPATKEAISSIDDLLNRGVRTFQIFLSSPQRGGFPKIDYLQNLMERLRKLTDDNLNIIVHGPYIISLVNPSVYKYTMAYYLKVNEYLNKVCDENTNTFIVTHVGSRSLEQDATDAMRSIMRFCSSWSVNTQGSRVKLCVENDVGSKNNTRMGNASNLARMVVDLKDDRIKMCFDTEHAWGAGVDLEDETLVDQILESCGVVHLNSIPQIVARGSHLDRHSTYLIEQGQVVDALKSIYNKASARGIPMVLERSFGLIQQDIDFIERW